MHHTLHLALVRTSLKHAFAYDPDPPFFRIKAGVLAVQRILLIHPLECWDQFRAFALPSRSPGLNAARTESGLILSGDIPAWTASSWYLTSGRERPRLHFGQISLQVYRYTRCA